jgi:hypothetical protein
MWSNKIIHGGEGQPHYTYDERGWMLLHDEQQETAKCGERNRK